MIEVSVFIAVTAGILSFLSPCVLPIVPSYLSFVTGMTLEDLQESTDRRNVMVHSVLFVAGFSLIFILLGAGASFLGVFFSAHREWIARIGGVIIIVLGLHLMGVFRIMPLMRERRLHLSDKPSGHLGTLAVGAAFGAGWTPCIGPVLGAILGLAGTQETIWSGMGLLAAYSFGLAIPFLLAALAFDRFLNTFRRMRRYIPVLEKASGALLIVLGILLVTGSFTVLSTYLVRFTPEFLLERI
ncbi:MAG: cytochrome c biogenesis protein CcdA [Gemmatimonadetes bacterium]|nr:cytochrome c biogenesis protein CcdA [Gemmatimonadota bacterium]